MGITRGSVVIRLALSAMTLMIGGCDRDVCHQIQGIHRTVGILKSRLMQDPQANFENCRNFWPSLTDEIKNQGVRLEEVATRKLGRREPWPLNFPPLGQCIETQAEDIPQSACFRANESARCSPVCAYWIPSAARNAYRNVLTIKDTSLAIWEVYEQSCFGSVNGGNQMLNKITNEIEPALLTLSRHFCSQN